MVLLFAGLVTGFSKFSVGGMGMLILPIIMIVYPGQQALGILLPMYLATDLLAVISYRKHVNWPLLGRLLPMCGVGIIAGGWLLSRLDSADFSVMLAIIIISMLVLGIVLDTMKVSIMQHPLSTKITGFLGGFVSLISNAAGPIFSLFFMEQKLSKAEYVSTRSWAFMAINLAKVPVLLSVGALTMDTAVIGLQALPGLVVGAAIGFWFLSKLKLEAFKWLIRVMAGIAAIKLMVF